MRRRFLVGGSAICALVLTATPTRAADKDEIKAAIEKGVAFLKNNQQLGGSWHTEVRDSVPIDPNSVTVGATALVGLTLVECEVRVDDDAIVKAADFVRRGSVYLTSTYALSLAIMFLDRLGDPDDDRLIQSMGIRLLAGQTTDGGWVYQCPDIGPDEAKRLLTAIKQRSELSTKRPKAQPADRKERPALPKELQDQLRSKRQRPSVQGGDNSNTQFAMLALWVARRHGLPVEQALTASETRFRGSQHRDGGWSYMPGMPATPAMTCAGLLGLAVGQGVTTETALRTGGSKPRNAPTRAVADAAVRAGLTALGNVIGQPTRKKRETAQLPRAADGNLYYFLWSLERVAVIYGLTTIGGKDWYGWGSEVLLERQGRQGAWIGKYGMMVDTSFALLFLRRANLARDLTATLKGKVQDPGEARLTSGGGNQPGNKPGSSGDDPKTPVAKNPTPAAPANSDNDEAAVARLSNQLVNAAAADRERLLEQYRDAKGFVYTDALAIAIPQLSAEAKIKARDALAERLTRMTAATIRKKLKEDSSELRRAAALACAMKEEKQHIPDLIAALEDREMSVVLAARTGLKHLTKQDFGPRKDATAAERTKAVEDWKEWWKKHEEDVREGGTAPNSVGTSKAGPIEAEVKKLQGTWTVLTLEMSENKSGKIGPPKTGLSTVDSQLTFRGNKFVSPESQDTYEQTYVVDPTKIPRTIDVRTSESIARGIYSLFGDHLVLCLAGAKQDRPVDFAKPPKADSEQCVMVLKRGQLEKGAFDAIGEEMERRQGTWTMDAVEDESKRLTKEMQEKTGLKIDTPRSSRQLTNLGI